MRWSGIQAHEAGGSTRKLDERIERRLLAAISDVFEDEDFAEAVMSFVPGRKKARPNAPAEVSAAAGAEYRPLQSVVSGREVARGPNS